MNSIARAVPDAAGSFQHSFGGSLTYRGIVPRGNSQPLHLLYTFDTTDPLFPVQLSSARFLPLFYSFAYHADGVGYRVLSDNEIEILNLKNRPDEDDFPYENYPDAFPETAVSLVPISYEEHKTLVYYLACQDYDSEGELKIYNSYGGRAGEECENYDLEDEYLSSTDQEFLKRSRYPFTQLGGIHRMWQGIPDVSCPNAKCKNHKSLDSMDVLAVVWNEPVPGVYIWNNDPEFRDNTEVQIIFQICSQCQSIYACSRCT